MDILHCDRLTQWESAVARTVTTARFGPFRFQIGVDASAIELLSARVEDARQRLIALPLEPVAHQLQREVVVSSIYGTNSIEGGTLTEQETEQAIALPAEQIAELEQRRVANLKRAYDLAQQSADQPQWQPDLSFVQRLHATITADLPHEQNRPGLLRDNPKGLKTYVGDPIHGGRYQPPQYGGDVRTLLESLLQWHRDLAEQAVPARLRAPLLHYYYEQIHPFWDGNGRVGRVLEATVLLQAGYPYAPFVQSRFYYDHLDRYFALFNQCRKQVGRTDTPNTPFVLFFLEGLLQSLNQCHDRVSRLVGGLLLENELRTRHDRRALNDRQYAIATQILHQGGSMPLVELRRAAWYRALYGQLTDKTQQRDLRQLRDLTVIRLDEQQRLWIQFPSDYPLASEK